MSRLCTHNLSTHLWRPIERLMLSPDDCEGFSRVLLIWECARCACHVWADGIVHETTQALSPERWEAITQDVKNPWQQHVERHRRADTQRAHVRATVLRWSPSSRRSHT